MLSNLLFFQISLQMIIAENLSWNLILLHQIYLTLKTVLNIEWIVIVQIIVLHHFLRFIQMIIVDHFYLIILIL